MKWHAWVALALMLSVSGCTSVQSSVIADEGLSARDGKVLGVVQVNRSTLTLFLDFVDVTKIDWDTTQQLLLAEARGMGAEKVQLVSAHTSPRGGWWSLLCILACVNSTEMVALAVTPAPAADQK